MYSHNTLMFAMATETLRKSGHAARHGQHTRPRRPIRRPHVATGAGRERNT